VHFVWQHAVEVLIDPSIRSRGAMVFFVPEGASTMADRLVAGSRRKRQF
jgi:hypothetical protein